MYLIVPFQFVETTMHSLPLRLSRRLFCTALLACLPLSALADSFVSERISVRTEGHGPDVILVPGLGSSPKVWAGVLAKVPGYRYHLVQVNGFAGVPMGGNKEGPVAAPVAEEIARYVTAQGLHKPAFIGHSMGGSIGIMLATRHPDALSKLMVVDMVPFLGALFGPPGTTAENIRPTADALMARKNAMDPDARKKSSEATVVGMINNTAMQPVGIEDSNRSDTSVTGRAFHELIVTDLRSELPKMAAPVTVLYVTPKGMPASDAQFDSVYKAAYAGAKEVTLKRVPDSAHFIMWDQPQRFEEEVKTFLK
jgi:pimeloyl-ACP methyl ester carboxylesterase